MPMLPPPSRAASHNHENSNPLPIVGNAELDFVKFPVSRPPVSEHGHVSVVTLVHPCITPATACFACTGFLHDVAI